MIHLIEHALGLCGEKHISILGVLMEYHNININYLFNYIKLMYGRL